MPGTKYALSFALDSAVLEREYCLSRRLFVTGIGLSFAIAFASLWVQVLGLYGQDGILPAERILNHPPKHLLSMPTVLWFWPHFAPDIDTALNRVCAIGTLAGTLVCFGWQSRPLLFVCWLLYLSMYTIGQTFMSFQWDILLLETGFLAILYAPPLPFIENRPLLIVRALLKWLLFRLMFASGIVKLNRTWTDLTALNFHYWTQPLPNPISWYVHHLPSDFHSFSVVCVFIIECIFPFFLFTGYRWLRILAALAFSWLMGLIFLTGNYNFFNLLTLSLCFTVFDDKFLLNCLPTDRLRLWMLHRYRRFYAAVLPPGEFESSHNNSTTRSASVNKQPQRRSPPSLLRRVTNAIVWLLSIADTLIITAICALVFFASLYPTLMLVKHETVPPVLVETFSRTYPFALVGSYGLFRQMTQNRPEIVIEGSRDGVEWKTYEFAYKPTDLKRAPPFVAPHQPRLDWQLWFAAMVDFNQSPWLMSFLSALLRGSPEVEALLAMVPFVDEPPKYIRMTRYWCEFSPYNTTTGEWWTRKMPQVFLPPTPLNHRELQEYLRKNGFRTSIVKKNPQQAPIEEVILTGQ